MKLDAIEAAIAEAERRLAISDRDVLAATEHFVTSVRAVCRGWGLTAERWLDGGAGTPTLAVTRQDGTAGVLKVAGEIMAAEESESGSGVALLREECRRLAEITDADLERVWRWAFVERATTALYLRWHGYADESASFLETAAILAR